MRSLVFLSFVILLNHALILSAWFIPAPHLFMPKKHKDVRYRNNVMDIISKSRSKHPFDPSTTKTQIHQSTKNGPEYYRPSTHRPAPQGGDMSYIESNIRRAAMTFKEIRKIGGVTCSNDVYARHPTQHQNKYWYIGKVARTDGTVSLEKCISRQWNLIEEHACRLRPVELGRAFGLIEIYTARGDSELEMSQHNGSNSQDGNYDDLGLKKMCKYVPESQNVDSKEVGFIAEVVTNEGQGFFILRDDDGKVLY